MKLVLITLFLSSPLLAQTIQVQQLDSKFDMSGLANSKTKTHTLNDLDKLPEEKRIIPYKSVIEQALKKAGLENEISNMDRLDRDQLFLRATSFNSTALIKFYPDLPKDKLINLSNLVNTKKTNEMK